MISGPPVDVRSILLDGNAIQEAQRETWREVLDRHKRLGHPIVVWRDGQVVWIPAEEIEIPTAGAEAGPSPSVATPGDAAD